MANRSIPGEKVYQGRGQFTGKRGSGASNKPNGEPKENVQTSVQDVRSDPEVLEVFLEGRGNLVH